MNKIVLFFVALSLLIIVSCTGNKYEIREFTDDNGYTYELVTNDPTGTRVYTLENGLKVYLSVNKDEPRIMSYISVRSGSMNDPVESTGLAHYFEHLLFKGTDDFGTLNWSKEKLYIDSISQLFEKHRSVGSEEEKKAIYKEIDRLSQIASTFAVPNEYDRLTSAIGATNTNAFTSYEHTTYINEIPSNELERWLEIEKERFQDPVLRLFHTELETVYEEYNMYQDMDRSRQHKVLLKELFPNHPLGRPIIGFPEHLKNPSMQNIRDYYNTWYVPNNMAVILSGDLNFDETIVMVDKAFGMFEPKTLPEIKHPVESPVAKVKEKEVVGPDAENVMFAYRFQGRKSSDVKYVYMIDMILNNRVAGLIDLNLVQKQTVLNAGSAPEFFSDYGIHFFYGMPRHGQTLEEVRDLILAEIEKVKRGEFEKWLPDAIINNFRVDLIKALEGNGRVSKLLDAFVFDMSIADLYKLIDEMDAISVEELVAFANEHYTDNYVLVYKRNGEPEGIVKVEKPLITPVVLNRDGQSAFMRSFLNEEVKPVEPVFIDYSQALKRREIRDGLELNYVKNETNDLFELSFIWDMGNLNDKKLALAMNYLSFLGAENFSAEDINKEFYKLGITFSTSVNDNQSFVTLTGLSKNMLAGLELLEHLMSAPVPDSIAYMNLIERIEKGRNDKKKNQKAISAAILNYAKYGKNSPMTHILSQDELKAMEPTELTSAISSFNTYKHRVFYYGPYREPEVAAILKRHHRIEVDLKDVPEEKQFETQGFNSDKVLFLDYPKSQVEILFLSKDIAFNEKTMVEANLFNEYYGGNMSSVVFQELREAKALAYSVWAGYVVPQEKQHNFFVQAAIFTQTDKMMDAINAMDNLLDTIVWSEMPFEIAKNNIIKSIQTDRITRDEIFWSWDNNQKMGINHDIREDYYKAAQSMGLKDISTFFNNHIRGKAYNYIIIGNGKTIHKDQLKSIGPIRELTLEEVFGY